MNSDALGGQVGSLLSHNVFVYCLNNPINMDDSEGLWPAWMERVGNAIKIGVQEYVKAVGQASDIVLSRISPLYNHIIASNGKNISGETLTEEEKRAARIRGNNIIINGAIACTVAPINTPNLVLNPNQQAVIQLGKEAKQSGGITMQEAKILVEWGKEYGINSHGPMIHPNRSGIWSYTEHINIFKYHIPIFPK